MSFKPTIIVFALALLSVLAAVYVARNEPASARARAGVSEPLISDGQFPVDQVTRMTLSRAGGPTMTFQRTDGHWWQIAPFRCPMDRYSMHQLAAVVQQVQVVQRLSVQELADGMSLAGLSLDPPDAVVSYEWPEGSLQLELGRKGVAGRAYLRIAGEEDILVVRQDLHDRAVEMDVREWRDRTIFHDAGVDAERIVRSGGDSRVVMQRGRGGWRMLEPVETRLDTDAMNNLLQAVAGAQSGGFLADEPGDLNRFGLEPPTAEFSVTVNRLVADGDEPTRETAEQRLLIGMPVGAGTQDRYGMIDGRLTVMRLPAAVLQALFRQPRSLIDPTGSGVEAADVRAIRIAGETQELVLERDRERWRAVSHNRVEVPAGYVNELLQNLTQLRAGEVQIAAYPHEMQVATVTLMGFNQLPIDTVRVVRDAASDIWAFENGDNVLRVFSAGFRPRLTAEDFGLETALDQ